MLFLFSFFRYCLFSANYPSLPNNGHFLYYVLRWYRRLECMKTIDLSDYIRTSVLGSWRHSSIQFDGKSYQKQRRCCWYTLCSFAIGSMLAQRLQRTVHCQHSFDKLHVSLKICCLGIGWLQMRRKSIGLRKCLVLLPLLFTSKLQRKLMIRSQSNSNLYWKYCKQNVGIFCCANIILNHNYFIFFQRCMQNPEQNSVYLLLFHLHRQFTTKNKDRF